VDARLRGDDNNDAFDVNSFFVGPLLLVVDSRLREDDNNDVFAATCSVFSNSPSHALA